ncbi:uncharacterized protein LOC111077271 [Drosophila obscura]|uniref:uncharacterized protein LOC111077271 n=1 Tax=Drosophila obscura TaxID=7282 RepID=UPI001BB2030D|nr:uncharacterized protein LOC111077271 [Drosophila obscura]
MVLGRTWIILGLIGSIACLASGVPQFLDAEDDAFLYDDSLSDVGSSNGQKFASSATTITENGHTLIYGTGDSNKLTYNGHRILVDDGSLTLLEGDKPYAFFPLGASVEKRKSIKISGHPATVQFSRGNVFLYLSDGSVVAKIGSAYFVGDRYAVEHRDAMIHRGNL